MILRYKIPLTTEKDCYKCGIKRDIIDEVLEEHGFQKIKQNPYLFLEYDVDFKTVDRFAFIHDFPAYHKYRISALVDTAYKYILNTGSTKCTLSDLIKVCHKIEVYKTAPMFIASYLLETYHIKGEWIESRHYWHAEKRIANRAKRLIRRHPAVHVYESTIEEIEQELNVRYDDTQKQAFELLNSGIGILTGGPGTGKTTVLKGIILAVQKITNRQVVCCAPTGKAAERMREATNHDAQTIHRTLGIMPFTVGGYEVTNRLDDNSLVIVDEASMIDTDVMDCLTLAVQNAHATLLLVGDADQLPSVGPGNILHDLMKCPKIPVVQLNTIHRQGEGSAIIENSRRIREGETKLLYDKKTFFSRRYEDVELLAGEACGLYRKYIEAGREARIYTPVKDRSYKTSTKVINATLHKEFHKGEEEFAANAQLFSVGDPVVITQNDYDEGLMNGDEGKVEKIDIENEILSVRIGKELHHLHGEQLQHIDLAYAVTVHKAQGSSCEVAIVICPEEPKPLLTRQLLYVAITRAEKKAFVLYERSALWESIKNFHADERLTSLPERWV